MERSENALHTNKIGRGVEGFGEKWEASWNSLEVGLLKTGGSISKRVLFRQNPNMARIRKMKTGSHHENQSHQRHGRLG